MTQARQKARMAAAYDPTSVESRVYGRWMEGGYFTPEVDRSRSPFVVIMPPPNVTGELHMGHALTAALEDLMVRWHRMKGEPTLFLPGTDHAGIATQVVVERMLASEGISRHDLGRDRFVERVWEWVDRYGDRINQQYRRLGVSCDWTRSSFTLDEGPSRAVRTTFVNLYKKGLIYRGERITNWCTRCSTALSDLEVDHQEEEGRLYYVRYRAEDGGEGVVVATTRPETLLGDTGVAVNPEDGRYAGLVGSRVVLPVLGRRIPVVADEAVDPEFGTGALKVTPGHDPSDFEIGQRHGLPIVNVMNLDGTMNEAAGPYQGQDRFECRVKIVEQLEQERSAGSGVEPNPHAVGHCDRCDEVVEPLVSAQWYVRMEPLARPAREAVRDGRIRIVPGAFRQGLLQLDGRHPGLVRKPPALVGPPHSGLVLRRLRSGDRRNGGPVSLSEVPIDGVGAGPGRAGHLVLVRPVDALDAGLARRDGGPGLLLSRRASWRRAMTSSSSGWPG